MDTPATTETATDPHAAGGTADLDSAAMSASGRRGRVSLGKALMLAMVRKSYMIGSRVAPFAMVQRAGKVLCTPHRSSRRQAKAVRDDGGAVRDYLWVDGRRLAIYRWGDPVAEPYVLLAHGWSSFALRFLPWVKALRAHGYAVVGFDQPGHGFSEGLRCTLPVIVRALRAVAASHGPAAVVLAHSLGGTAALQALTEGLRANRAILIAPIADPIANAERFARTVGLSPALLPDLIRTLEMTASTSATDMQVLRRAPFLQVPALIMHDLGDREVPWTEGERCAYHWPGARLITTAGLCHSSILDEPMVIAEGLRFLHGETVGERVASITRAPRGTA